MTSLAATLTGVGVTAVTVDRSAPTNHTVQVEVTGDALPTAITVILEGSINEGQSFVEMATHIFDDTEIASGKALFHVANRGVSHLRATVTSVVGGTNLSIQIWIRDTK